MDNQTAKSIDRSLKAIATSLQKIEKNTRPVMTVPESPPVAENAAAQSIADRAMDDMHERIRQNLTKSLFREG